MQDALEGEGQRQDQHGRADGNALTGPLPSLRWLDGLPLLALREEQQQQEAMAAAHPVREAQGEGLHLRQ